MVISAIAPHAPGKVELNGTHWTAEADDDIPAGARVKVTEKDNLTLKVRPV